MESAEKGLRWSFRVLLRPEGFRITVVQETQRGFPCDLCTTIGQNPRGHRRSSDRGHCASRQVRNGRKGILVAKAVRPWGYRIQILSASVTVLLLHDFAAWRPLREEMHFRIWLRLRRAGLFCGETTFGFILMRRPASIRSISSVRSVS